MNEQNIKWNALRSELTNAEIIPSLVDQKTYENIRTVLSETRQHVISTLNSVMVQTYWEIGREINDAVGERADYGKQLLHYLAERLTTEFGKGFSERSLRHMRQFY